MGEPEEVVQDDTNFIESLLDCGVDVNLAKTSFSWEEEGVFGCFTRIDGEINYKMKETILHRAIMRNAIDLTLSLIKRGANVNAIFEYTFQKLANSMEMSQEKKDEAA